MKIVTAKGNQRGDNTNHHDQVIYPVNFKPMNNKANKVRNENPVVFDVVLFVLIYITSNYKFNWWVRLDLNEQCFRDGVTVRWGYQFSYAPNCNQAANKAT